MRRQSPGEKDWIIEVYPEAVCGLDYSKGVNEYQVRLSPGSRVVAIGRTAAQAWRRAYEKGLREEWLYQEEVDTE